MRTLIVVVALAGGLVAAPAPKESQLLLTPTKAHFVVGEEVDLQLTLTNGGNADIVLNPTHIRFLSGMKVVGPDGREVQAATNPVEIDPRPQTVTVAPGKSYAATLPGINVEKPGGRFQRHIRFPMDAPGIYTVTMVLAGLTGHAAVLIGAPPVTSRPAGSQPAALDGVAFGKTVDGLRLGLTVKNDFVQGRITARVVLQNAGDKPILVLPLLMRGATIDFGVTDPEGKPVRIIAPMVDWDVPDYDKAVKTLAPGEFVEKDLLVSGMQVTKVGKYTVEVTYTWRNQRPPPGRLPVLWNRGPIWTGNLVSGKGTFTLAEQTLQ